MFKKNDVLRFTIKHTKLLRILSHFKWYNDLVYRRAQEIIRNL